MAPRARKVKATRGLIHFSMGVQEDAIQDFLSVNKIDRVPNTPKYMATDNLVTIQVPPADEYICPDHIYVWLHSGD